MYFIFDCNENVVGNKKGYATFRGANIQANSHRAKAYKQIWAAYEAKKVQDPKWNFVFSIDYK